MEREEIQESLDFGPPRPLVREPHPGEMKSVCEVVGNAFFDDPVAEYLFPKETIRRQRFARLASFDIESYGESAWVLTNDAVQSVAIWQRPSPKPASAIRQFAALFRILRIGGRRFRRCLRVGEAMGAVRLQEPHYYLGILGTDPLAQGQGLGSALVDTVTQRCDAERLPAYLESSKESNIPFYAKHGFEVTGEIKVPDGPKLWPMLRSPR